MASVSVDVDIELDEFELDELLDEVESRYSSYGADKEDKKMIEEFINDFRFDFGQQKNPETKNLSLLDQMKIDLLISNISKIKLNDLESLIS